MNKRILGLLVGVATSVALIGTAGATPSPATQVGDMATDAAAELTPIILAVGAALVAVAVVRFGVRWVLSAVGRGGRA